MTQVSAVQKSRNDSNVVYEELCSGSDVTVVEHAVLQSPEAELAYLILS